MTLYIVRFKRPDTGRWETMPFSIESIRDGVAARLRARGVEVQTWEGRA